MDILYKHDSLFQGLRRGFLDIEIPLGTYNFLKPEFWVSIEPEKITVNVVHCLLSMHFLRKCINHRAVGFKNALKSKAAVSLGFKDVNNVSVLKNIGLKKEKFDLKVHGTPYGFYLSRIELIEILNACFGQKGWSANNIKTLHQQLNNKLL